MSNSKTLQKMYDLYFNKLEGGYNLDEQPCVHTARTRTVGFDSEAPDYRRKVLTVVETGVELPEPKVMIGTIGYHQLGQLGGDDVEDWFYAVSETQDYWIGNWITGFGFFNILFPKDTSRGLTQKELEYFNTLRFTI